MTNLAKAIILIVTTCLIYLNAILLLIALTFYSAGLVVDLMVNYYG